MEDGTNQYIRDHYNEMTDRQIAEKLDATVSSIKNRRIRMNLGKPQQGTGRPAAKVEIAERLGKISELLEKSGIQLDEVGKIDKVRVGTYQMVTKDADGEPHVHELEANSIILTPEWSTGPEWPVVQQAKPVNIAPVKIKKSGEATKLKTCVVFPDPQIGYRFYMDEMRLDPFHDETAIDVALQITKDIQPDVIVNLGDFLDLPAHSRFDQEPAFYQTTQKAIDYAHELLAKQRSLTPEGEVVLIEGNHDRRLPKTIMNNAGASYGLKRANMPADWPVLTVPFLLRLDELGVKYIDGYPAGQYYLCPWLKFKHGEKTGKRGTIAPAIVSSENVSVIQGHNHHIEQVFASVDTEAGQRTNFAATLGCLCRTDGAVPSTKGSTDSHGKPVVRHEDWQQAIGIVTYEDIPDTKVIPTLEIVHIYNGFALFRGKAYFANA